MPEVFGAEQQGGEARVERGVSHFEARAPGAGAASLIEGLGNLRTGLSGLVGDKELKEIGAFTADARKQIRSLTNPVERKLKSEEFTQMFLQKFGAKHSDKLSLLTAPEIQYKIDPNGAGGRGALISTDMGTGEKTFTPLSELSPSAGDEYKQSVGDAFAMTSQVSPTLAKTVDAIFKRGDIPGSHAMVTTSNAVNDAHMSLDRAGHELAQLEYKLNSIGQEVTPELRANFGARVRDNILLSFRTLTAKDYMDKLSGNNSLSPSDMGQVVDSMVLDYMSALQKGNLANRIGLDVPTLTKEIDTVRGMLLNSYKAAFEKDVTLQQRETTKASLLLDFHKSDFMLKLRTENPAAWRLTMTSTALQALVNTVYVASQVRSHLQPGAGVIEHEAGLQTHSMLGTIMGWNAAQQATHFLNLQGVSTASDIAVALRNMTTITQGGSLVFKSTRDVIDKWFATNMARVEAMGGSKEIPQELVNQLKAQFNQWKNRVKPLAEKGSADLTPENEKEVDRFLRLLNREKISDVFNVTPSATVKLP